MVAGFRKTELAARNLKDFAFWTSCVTYRMLQPCSNRQGQCRADLPLERSGGFQDPILPALSASGSLGVTGQISFSQKHLELQFSELMPTSELRAAKKGNGKTTFLCHLKRGSYRQINCCKKPPSWAGFQRMRFRATQLRGGSWQQAGRTSCISGLQVPPEHGRGQHNKCKLCRTYFAALLAVKTLASCHMSILVLLLNWSLRYSNQGVSMNPECDSYMRHRPRPSSLSEVWR